MPSFVSDYILKRNTIFILGDCKLAGNQPFQNKLRVRLPTIKWEVCVFDTTFFWGGGGFKL